MALFFADLVREASWGAGTGDLPLGGALPGHRRFADAVPSGARFHYCIAGVTHPDQWETGEGEIGSGGTLIRLPTTSSQDGEIVDFLPGLKTVALTVNAGWYAARDGAVAAIADVSGLDAALAGKADADHDHAGAFASASHGHTFAALSGRPSSLAGYGITDAQPLDPDLSAIAALGTTSFGRAGLALADAAALRSHAGLGTMATQAANAVNITGGALSNLTAINGVGGDITLSWQGSHDWLVGTQFSTFYENGIRLLSDSRETRLMAKAADGTGTISFHTGVAPAERMKITDNGVTVAGIEVGYRDIPIAGGVERGKCFLATANVTFHAVSAAGACFHVYNDSAGAISLLEGSGVTLRSAGTAGTGTRTLAQRGYATILFVASTVAVVTGWGVS